jgi:hypothetical protein
MSIMTPYWHNYSIRKIKQLISKSRGLDPQDELSKETIRAMCERIDALEHLLEKKWLDESAPKLQRFGRRDESGTKRRTNRAALCL